MKLALFLCMALLSIMWKSTTAQITWQKYPDNPVLRFWTGDINDPNGYKYALDPTVLIDQNGLYHMWFTSLAYGSGTSFCISEAFSTDRVRWFTSFKNPILRPGPLGTFEERGVRSHSVIRDSTGYKMYYAGFRVSTDHSIGLATSSDGITWTKYPGNPILDGGPPGAWDSLKVTTASVYFDGATYLMWYTGENGSRPAIGLAASTDGVNWTKYAGNPILAVGPSGAWDDEFVACPKVVKVGGMFHMFYDGNGSAPGTNAARIGYAFSSDGMHWTKHEGNPLPLIGNASEWDGQSLGTGAVVFQDNKFHLWYAGLGQPSSYPQAWQTGYATSDYTPVNVPTQSELPKTIWLSQSYPNPFNPGTTISYQLPKQSYVTLKVFDILGREVIKLVDGLEEPGYKSVTFDASNFATGEYFYRLTTDGVSETKKMSLMK